MSYIDKIKRLQALKLEIENSKLPDALLISRFKEALNLSMDLILIMNCGGVSFDNNNDGRLM